MLVLLLMLSSAPVWGRPQAPTPGQADQQPQSQLHSVSTALPIPIVSQSESVGADGSFNFSYETGNGIHVQEGGYVKKVQLPQGQSAALNADGSQRAIGDDNVQVITGAFSYKAPDGTEISLKYIADENGFQPEGAHLPTPPPIPPEIQRALSMLSNKTEQQRSAEFPEDLANQGLQQTRLDVAQGSATNIEEEESSHTAPDVDVIVP